VTISSTFGRAAPHALLYNAAVTNKIQNPLLIECIIILRTAPSVAENSTLLCG
jgi:hypothetical protein